MIFTFENNTDTFHPNVKEHVSQILRATICDKNKVLFVFKIMLQTTICDTSKVLFTFEINTDTFHPNVKEYLSQMLTDYYLSYIHSSYLQNTDNFHTNVKEHVSQM